MYLLYLTTPRIFALLGLIDRKSPAYDIVYGFITNECPQLYFDLLDMLANNGYKPNYMLTNFVNFFGKQGDIAKLDMLINKRQSSNGG